MKKLLATMLCATLLLVSLSGCGDAPSEPQASTGTAASTDIQTSPKSSVAPQKLTIGAATVGGGFHNGASALANAINTKLEGYEIAVEVTGASAANAALLYSGDIPLGMVDTTTAYEAYMGIEDFEGKQCDTLRTFIPGWPGTFIFVTRADSGYANITDLSGKRFSGGTTGSGAQIFFARCFGNFGIDYTELALPNADAVRGIGDNTIDGYGLMYPNSSVTELEASYELKILTLDKEQEEAFKKAYPQYLWLPIPGGAYKCVPETIYNPGAYNLFCTTSEVDEETIYQIVKCAYENLDLIATVFPQCAEGMTPENLNQNIIPYHAGAVRYFEEQGWEVPESLIPPEMK